MRWPFVYFPARRKLTDASCSAAKGIQERDYAFDLDFFAEIVPEVRYSLPKDLDRAS